MRDPLTPDDLEAILRGGGSAADKLQRAARMALEKRAMGKDLLTEEECRELLTSGRWWRDALQAAARLGAERERERAARVCEQMDLPCYPHRRGMPSYCAAAIRRGEGE